MDGISATRAIRAEEQRGARVPIVALTATGDPQACLHAGMDEWLPKPLSIARLNQAMENILTKAVA
jgi:CheY-like chemotaxis protein